MIPMHHTLFLPTIIQIFTMQVRTMVCLTMARVSMVDMEGSMVDMEGSMVEMKGSMVDLEDSMVEMKGPMVDLEGSMVDLEGSMVDLVDSMVDLEDLVMDLVVQRLRKEKIKRNLKILRRKNTAYDATKNPSQKITTQKLPVITRKKKPNELIANTLWLSTDHL